MGVHVLEDGFWVCPVHFSDLFWVECSRGTCAQKYLTLVGASLSLFWDPFLAQHMANAKERNTSDAEFFCEFSYCCLLIRFSRVNVSAGRVVESPGVSDLNQDLPVPVFHIDSNGAMGDTRPVGTCPFECSDDLIVFVDNNNKRHPPIQAQSQTGDKEAFFLGISSGKTAFLSGKPLRGPVENRVIS